MTDLHGELQRLLRERSDDIRPSPTIPRTTLRKARLQRAMVVLGTGAAVVALGVAGFLVLGAEGVKDDVADAPGPRVVASESQGGLSWALSVSRQDEEICARLEVVRSRNAGGEVHETCAPEDEVVDARLTEVWDIPLAWGSVSSEVSEVNTEQWGFSTLIGFDPPEFFDLPDEFGSERRLFLAFDPNGIDAVAAKDSGGETLDTVAVGPHDPVRIASGRIENSRWSLTARPTVDGICVTVEQTTETGRAGSTDSNTLCGINGTELSLTQVSFDGVDRVLVFGTVPVEAQRAALVLEATPGDPQPLRVRRGVRDLETFYATVVDDVKTEGAVVTLGRGGTELDRRALCAPRTPSMLNRSSVNPPLFCGDGTD